MKEYLKIFWAFMKVGALTFGGGYAMLPILQREVVEHNGWATEEEIMDYYAMGQCLPGIIMVNTSVFVGRRHKGVAGGIVAGLGSAFPSLVIITVIAMFLTAFAEYPVVQNAFAGVRACVVVLIFLPVFLLSALTSASPILLVVASGVAGVLISVLAARGKGAAK